ncbi:MAG TPA: glycosyltransferase family 4 protein [Acidimicrobiales bacterium]|nr:glycosyltransferase family 4 protein [Acidimicrobiales bacterium]
MLHVDLPPEGGGGVASQVSRLADVLTGRGHDVTVRTLSALPPRAAYSVERIPFPASARQSRLCRLAGVPLLFAAGRYAGFDVVHAHGDSHLLLRHCVPTVRTFYGSAKDEARHAERFRRRLSQQMFVPAERIARYLATVAVGISDNTARSVGPLDAIIPCGVNRADFKPRRKSNAPSVLFVGTMGGRKRGQLLLDAFTSVVLPRVPDAQLWVVSADRAEGRGVRWFGRVNEKELLKLFASAWVFCLPSSYEGFGVPYIEAMASGTAVVASRNAGSSEVVLPESGGVIVEDELLGQTITSLLLDSGWRRRLERRGPIYSERFDWLRVAEAYESVYALALSRVQQRNSSAHGHHTTLRKVLQ